MATFTNQTKNAVSVTNLSKNAASPTNQNKYVHPWDYNQSGYSYNQATDPTTGQVIYYNSIGLTTFSNLAKS